MKKANPNQKTLFQSWGKNDNQALKTEEEKNHYHSSSSIEIIDLGDDDEDDGLLAAALEMESIDLQENQENVIQNSSCAGNVSKEVEYLPGFDMENGNVWIYPTNYPIRDYQFEIVEKALFMNTLVTLPTGLGKTFIAAVLMYNFYRWYPQGKVIFMAPTKPLVAQQIEACYNIMGIPQSDTAQMTGNMAPTKREIMWKTKRVFFLTPQVLQNDLSRGSCSAEDVVLLVFDEAHKALGNHAYCQVVKEISNYTRNFRVLALSATPGDDVKAVQQVMTNLFISHMELRSEDSQDIQPYTHSRTVEKIVVPLGDDISRIKTQFLKVLEVIVGRLFCNRALWQKDPQRVTKYMLLSGRDQFRKRNLEGYTNGQKGAIEGDFAMAISLYHAYELLHQHGILSFYNFIKAIIDGSKGMVRAKTEIMRNSQFMETMEELRESIECPPDETADTSALFSQFTSPRRRSMHKQPFDPSFKSHPKLLKLEEVIVEHFQRFNSEASASASTENECGSEAKPAGAVNTRVMIFSQYRDSVGEITAILNKHKPLVRVMSFIGQATTGKSSRGLSQKEQLEVVQRFRKGGYNTLVATCVGEEGLDIGDVDLIVCFDAHASPIRLVQRMGRTGRKRNGRIVVLVSEGKEEQIYKRSLSNKKSIHKAIIQGTKSFELYDDNPRMIPRHLTPRVLKMQMTVGSFVGNTSKKKRKSDTSEDKSSISSFLAKTGTSKSPNLSRKDDGFLTYEELIYWQENFKLPNCEAGMTPQKSNRRRSRKSLTDAPNKKLSLNEWMAWQNVPSPVYKISHSRRTEHLIEILEFLELHGETDSGDDAYDVEMMSFLNEEDLVGPEDDAATINDDDDDDDESKNCIAKNEKKNENSDKLKKNTKQTKTKKKSRNSKSITPPQKTKWREYLKGFENEDNDFDTGEKEASVHENVTEEPDNQTKGCGNPNKDEISRDLVENFEVEVGNEGSKENEEIVTENNAKMEEEEEEEPLEVSSQTFSQLLPSLTPQKAHVLRSRITDITDDHAKDVPLPPSLDSLNEISPFTPTKNSGPLNSEKTQKLHQNKRLSCRRNINYCTEMTVGNNENNLKGVALKSKIHRNNVVQEPPDLDLDCEFGKDIEVRWETKEMDEKWEIKNVSKELNKNKAHKNKFIDEPPDLDFECEFGEFCNEEENLMLKNKGSAIMDKNSVAEFDARNRDCFPEPPDSLPFDEIGDNSQGKTRPQPFKAEEKPGFGAGIVCKASTSDVFDDDIDIEFGDESLADGLLADLDENEIVGHNSDIGSTTHTINQGLPNEIIGKSGDEKRNSIERKNLARNVEECAENGDGKTSGLRNENVSKKSKLKLNSKENLLCDKSLKKSILKLNAFERNNTMESKKRVLDSAPKAEKLLDSNIKNVMTEKVDFEDSDPVTENTVSDKKLFRSEESFNFKKPDTIVGTRSMKLNRNIASPKTREETKPLRVQNCSPSFTSSPLRMSLTSNGRTYVMNKEIKRNKEPSLRDDQAKSSKENTVSLQEKQKSKHSFVEVLRTSPTESPLDSFKKFLDTNNKNCSSEKESTHTIDRNVSSFIRKPLRERLASSGLGDIENIMNLPKVSQKDFSFNSSVEDSPIVRKRSKGRTLPNIAEISPLQESPNFCKKVSVLDQKESPVIRRRSKVKIRDGNVFAIAESDDEFENDIEESDLQFVGGKTSKLHCSSDVQGKENCRNKLLSDSEEELSIEMKGCNQDVVVRHAAQRKIVLQNSVKRKRLHSRLPSKKQKRLHVHHFVEEEAELSGSDINGFSDEESELGDEFDSFIDDSTQLTQRTPSCRTTRDPRSPMDMGVVYRQSLMSPHARNLNFATPNYRSDRNRYKMKFKPTRTTKSGSESEAEETYARESDLENELGFESEGDCIDEEEYEMECLYGDENESPHHDSAVVQEVSPYAQSQVRRPLKRTKRKYILNDSIDEDIISTRKTPIKASVNSSASRSAVASTQAFRHEKTNKESHKTDSFVSSSSLLTKASASVAMVSPASLNSKPNAKTSEKRSLAKRESISTSKPPDSSRKDWSKTKRNSCLSDTFDFDWETNGFSDSDLLDAVENDKNKDLSVPCSAKKRNILNTEQLIPAQEMQDIAFAMAATDDEVNLEMSEMPTFSLGLDFLGEATKANEQHSVAPNNQPRNNSAFPLNTKNTSVLNTSLKQLPPPQQQQEHLQQQQNGKKESKFTKIVSPHRTEGSNGQTFSFKSSSSVTVQPFKKESQNPSTLTPSNCSTRIDGCSNSGSPLVNNKGASRENGKAGAPTANIASDNHETNFCLKTNEHEKNNSSTPSNTSKNIPRAFVSPSQRDRDKLIILVDTKEICNAQVVSCLRRKHNIRAEVCQLINCDYVVSNRVGVIRKLVSAVANGANATKLVDKMRVMCDLYDRPCLIIEKDRVKPGEKERDLSKTHAYSHTLACIAQTHIKILFSESQEETAALLTELANMESKKKAAIQAPLNLNKETQQVFRFLLSIPRVSYITALNLCSSLRTLRDLISSSTDDLQKITRQLSQSRATEIYNYLRHSFDETMTAKTNKAS